MIILDVCPSGRSSLATQTFSCSELRTPCFWFHCQDPSNLSTFFSSIFWTFLYSIPELIMVYSISVTPWERQKSICLSSVGNVIHPSGSCILLPAVASCQFSNIIRHCRLWFESSNFSKSSCLQVRVQLVQMPKSVMSGRSLLHVCRFKFLQFNLQVFLLFFFENIQKLNVFIVERVLSLD